MSESYQRESDNNSVVTTNLTGHTPSKELSSSRWFYDVFVSYDFQMNYTRFSSIFLFLPLFLNFGYGRLDQTVLASSLINGTLFYESSIVAVCFVVPLVIDMTLDYCFQIFQNKSKNKTSGKKKKQIMRDFTNPELVNMLLGFLIVPLVAFVPRCVLNPWIVINPLLTKVSHHVSSRFLAPYLSPSRATPNLASIYLCCRKFQINMTVMTAVLSWGRSFPEHFSPLLTSCTIVPMTIAQTIQAFWQIGAADPSPLLSSSSAFTLYVLGYVLYWPAIAVFFLTAWRCVYRLFRQMIAKNTIAKETFSTTTLGTHRKKDGHRKEKGNMLFPFLYVLSGLSCFMIILLVFIISGSALLFTPKLLLVNNIVYIFLNICILNFCLRRVKYEAIKNLYRLIDSKKSYVRYIRYDMHSRLTLTYLIYTQILNTICTSTYNPTSSALSALFFSVTS